MLSRILARFTGRRRDEDDCPCKKVRELSSEYIDEELDQVTASRIKRHTSKCPPCDAFVRTLKSTVEMLKATPKSTAPSGFGERVRQSLRHERGTR